MTRWTKVHLGSTLRREERFVRRSAEMLSLRHRTMPEHASTCGKLVVDADGIASVKLALESATSEEARAELVRLLSDPQFHCTDRNRRFLQFVSEELFEGRQVAIKAYTIAVDVFGRPPDFDPATDPIVRIEATRLRASLSRYYEMHGYQHDVHIDLPRGRYIPEFLRSKASANEVVADAVNLAPSPDPVHTLDPSIRRLFPSNSVKGLAIALGVVGGLLLGAALLITSPSGWEQREGMSDRPTVAIRMLGDNSDSAEELRDAFTLALSRFQTLRIISGKHAGGGENGRMNASTEGTAQYLFVLKYDPTNSDRPLRWQVVDDASKEVLGTGVEQVVRADAANQQIGKLANQIAGDTGIINMAEARADLAYQSFGNGCVLRAYMALKSSSGPLLDAARTCLDKTIELRPGEAEAYAAQAMVLLRSTPQEMPDGFASQALEFANRAAVLQPDSVLGARAQMVALYKNGQPDAAIAAGQRALKLNPHDAATGRTLGTILFLTGKWEDGVSLVNAADRVQYASPSETILAFDAYRRGAYNQALQELQQLGMTDCHLTELLWIATLGRLGRLDEAAQHIAVLRRTQPRFEDTFASAMARRSITLSLAESLKSGLEAAGLKPQ